MQAEVNRPQCDHASPLFVAAENAHAAGDCRKHRRFGLQEFDGSVKVKFPIQAVFGKSKTKNFHQLCIIFGQFFSHRNVWKIFFPRDPGAQVMQILLEAGAQKAPCFFNQKSPKSVSYLSGPW